MTSFFENRSINEIMWKNMVQRDRSQMTIGRMRIAYCIPRATNKQSEYVILFVYPLQQWLYQSPSILCYTYMASRVSGFHGTVVQLIILYVITPCSFVHWCRNFLKICFFHSHDLDPKWRMSHQVFLFFSESKCYYLYYPSLQSTYTIQSHPHTNHFNLLGPSIPSLKKEAVYFTETPHTFNTTVIYSPEHTIWSRYHVHDSHRVTSFQ